jgi:CBS domain containing-hemolysin-like protein
MNGSNIALLAVLLLLSAFFSACETAITSVNKIKIKYLSEQNTPESKAAKGVLKVLERYEEALSAILIGNNLVNLSISAIATILALTLLPSHIAEEYGAVISTIVTTLIVITFGEILPKSIARSRAERFCLSIYGAISGLMFVLKPLSMVFILSQRSTAKLLSKDKSTQNVTEDELKHFTHELETEGVLEEQESSLVRNALDFDETTAGEILTPRVGIAAVSLTDTAEKIQSVFLSEGYSRMPVYDKTLDHICGILHMRDFTKAMLNKETFDIRGVIQEAIFIPALMKISEALRNMQRKKLHMAVVVDQYGGTQGIVTLEDIIEELVGEIWDESDEVSSPVVFVNKNTIEVSGKLAINDFNRYFKKRGDNVEINSDSNTLGGWIFELFGKIPSPGDVIKTSRMEITVVSMEKLRVGKVKIKISDE